MFDFCIADVLPINRVTKGGPMIGIVILPRDTMVKMFYVHAQLKEGVWRVFQVTVQAWRDS